MIDKNELEETLRLHKKYLADDRDGVVADLRWANLRDADLSGADLRWANLRCANLRDANLSYANLHYANLRDADLRYANLSYANLRDADLSGAVGNMVDLHTMQLDTWTVSVWNDTMQIGCQQHTIKKWFGFDDDTINKMDGKALAWWKKWKPVLEMIVKMVDGKL